MSLKKYIILLLPVFIVIATVMAPGCAAGEVETPVQQIEDISAQDAWELIQDNKGNPDFIALDVRTPAEYEEEHVEGAIIIDFNAGDFREEVDKLDKDKAYLLYCRSGNRSGRALAIMKELGFLEIYHMNGGILEWTAEDLPLEN